MGLKKERIADCSKGLSKDKKPSESKKLWQLRLVAERMGKNWKDLFGAE